MKIVKFLDFKNSSIISTFEYYSDYYKNRGNIKIPELLYFERLLTFYCKNINKFFILITLFIKTKWSFRPLEKNKIVILGYDDHFKQIYLKKKYSLIPINIHDLNKIHFSIEIFKNFLKFKFKHKLSLKMSYIAALIKLINPRKIVSFNDNYEEFHLLSKIFYSKDIEIIAIQNAVRFIEEKFYDCKFHKFLTFGEFEKEIYKKEIKKKNIDQIIPIGSYKCQLAEEYFKKANLTIAKKFDICLISEPDLRDLEDYQRAIGLLADFAIQYCKKNQKTLIFSGKSDLNNLNDQEAEKQFYRINSETKNLKIKFQDKSKFESYQNIAESKVVISTSSSMLREAMHFNTKVLACRFIEGDDYFLPTKEINYISKCSYEDFEKKLNTILNMSYSKYLEEAGNLTYLYNNNIDGLKKINQIIDS